MREILSSPPPEYYILKEKKIPPPLQEMVKGGTLVESDQRWWEREWGENYEVVLTRFPAKKGEEEVEMVRLNFLNSGAIPQELLDELAQDEQVKRLAQRLGVLPRELLFYLAEESEKGAQRLEVALDLTGEKAIIVGLYGIIVSKMRVRLPTGEGKVVTFLYRNASVSHPDYHGVYSHSVRANMKQEEINLFGASTNHGFLPLFWKRVAGGGWGRSKEPEWVTFPHLDEGGVKVAPPGLQKIIEAFRKEEGLNVISGTPPDWERGMIRFAQKEGVRRAGTELKNSLYRELSSKYNFDPERGDQILFLAVHPDLLVFCQRAPLDLSETSFEFN